MPAKTMMELMRKLGYEFRLRMGPDVEYGKGEPVSYSHNKRKKRLRKEKKEKEKRKGG
jgi:hypothetical protein